MITFTEIVLLGIFLLLIVQAFGLGSFAIGTPPLVTFLAALTILALTVALIRKVRPG